MAKKTSPKKAPKTPKPAKVAKPKAVKAEPKMTPRQAVEGFNPKGRTSWSEYTKAQKDGDLGRTLGLNETGLSINLDDREAGVKSIDRIVDEFDRLSSLWPASAAYGRQHFNGDGFCHRDGLTRISDDSLGILAAQALEELAQRSIFKGTAVGSAKRDPTTADKVFKTVLSWAASRPAAVKSSRRDQAWRLASEEIGGKTVSNLELVS